MSPWPSALLLAGIWGASGRITPGERVFSLRVEANEQCVSPEGFRADLETALPRYDFALSSESKDRLLIIFQPVGDETEVSILLERSGAAPFSRKLRAQDCDEARLAARFVVSVALGEAREEKEEGEGAGGSSGPSSTGDRPADASAAEGRWEAAPLLTPETSKDGRRRSRASSAGYESDAWVRGGFAVLSGPAPSPLLGGTLGAGWGSRRVGAWSPALELEVAYSTAFPARAELGSAGFDWGALGLLACPSLFPLGPLRIRPCALGHFGFLRATGSDTFDPGSSTRPWMDLGLRLGLSLPLAKRLEIQGAADVSFPFIRDSFLFDSEVFYTVAPFSAGASLGLLVHLW